MPHTREAGRAAGPAWQETEAGGTPGTLLRLGEADKDRPLREDMRLLGRILGDTVREQQGERIFDIIERIRLSIGTQTGPRIGAQKGPLAGDGTGLSR